MKHLKTLTYILSITLLLACQNKLLTVHKIDVQQGNALDAEMVDKVKIGMNKEQVRYVLGSPIITDSFHPDRWDYIYLFIPGYGEQERRQLTLKFDRDEVIDINRHNILESDSLDASTDKDTDNANKENKEEKKEDLSKKDREKLEEIEKQADNLEDVLEENKNLEN
ncbi:MAG: outer membrane protein assembly factor BamE [Gammaproteobacteria bacterium]|nr:MAG: outer membrane protein assembly factor BamE [Gammaproteobacteria bacterium]